MFTGMYGKKLLYSTFYGSAMYCMYVCMYVCNISLCLHVCMVYMYSTVGILGLSMYVHTDDLT